MMQEEGDASQIRQAAEVRGDVGDERRPQEAQGVGQEADAGQGGEGVSSQVDATVASVTRELTEIEADKQTAARVREQHEIGIRIIDRKLDDLRTRHTEKCQQLLGLIEVEGEQLAIARWVQQSDER